MVVETRYWWQAPPEVPSSEAYAWREEKALLRKAEPWRLPDNTYDIVGLLADSPFANERWKEQQIASIVGGPALYGAINEIRTNIGYVTGRYPSESYDLWQYLYGIDAPTLDREYTPGEATELANAHEKYAQKVTAFVNYGGKLGHDIYGKKNAQFILETYPEWAAEYQTAKSYLEARSVSKKTGEAIEGFSSALGGKEFIEKYYPQWSEYWRSPEEIHKAKVKRAWKRRSERIWELRSRAAEKALSPELYAEWEAAGGAKKKWGTLPTILTSEERSAGREGKTAAEYAEWEEEANYGKWGEFAAASDEYKASGVGTPEFAEYMTRELEPYKAETGGYDIWAAYQSGKFTDIQLKGMFGDEVEETLFQMRKQMGYAGRGEMPIPMEYAPAAVEEPRVTMGAISGEEYAERKETALVPGQPVPPRKPLSDLQNLERIDYRRRLLAWAKEQGIADPEELVRHIMGVQTGEVSMRAISEEEKAGLWKLPPQTTLADYYRPILETFLVDPFVQENLSHTLQLYTKKEVASVLGESLARLPNQVIAAILQLPQGWGGASAVNKGWADRYISLANKDINEFTQEVAELYPSIPVLREVAQLSRNLAYSITSMGAGLAVGVPIAYIPLPGARYAAWAAGTSASGWVAYQMTTYQIMQEYLELKNAENIQQMGRELTIEEENKLKQDFSSLAKKYGLWEAIPEAISNLTFGLILVGPLGKMVGGPMAQRILGKIGMMYGEELLTETITQKGQSDIEVVAGLRENRISLWEAFKEIAPQTFLLTTIMAGAGQVIVSSSQAIKKATKSLKKEIGETHPLYEEIKKGIETGAIPQEGIQVPVEGITPVAVKPRKVVPTIRPFEMRLTQEELVTVPGAVFHGTDLRGMLGILDKGFITPFISKGDPLGQTVISMSRFKAVGRHSLLNVEVVDRGFRDRGEAIRGDVVEGLEVVSDKTIPISDIKSVTIELGIDETLAWKDPSTGLTFAEIKKLIEKKGIKVIVEQAVKPTATAGKNTAIDSIIGKLTAAVRAAKPARVETEKLKTAELARRIPRARKAALGAKPEEAAFAARGQLKGELPKARFTPPEIALVPGDINALYEYLRSRLLVDGKDFFKWGNTDAALRTLLAGAIPTRGELVLLEDVFGPDLIEAILSKRPLSQKVGENLLDVFNIPRVLQTINDLSAFFRQGAFIVMAHPKIGARALVVDVKSFVSGKYAEEIDQFIRSIKHFDKLVKHGLYVAPLGEGRAAKLSEREEMFMSRLIKKVPVLGPLVKMAERAYINTLNYMRVTVGSKLVDILEKGDYPAAAYEQLATLINWATGRGPIGKLANMTPVLNTIVYAARLQTSRWAMLFGGYKFTAAPVRKEYARLMLSFFGGVSGIVALGALAGLWEVEKDPRSSDFGKIRIGNTRLDPWAGFQPIIRLMAQLITGLRKTATGRIQDISRMETLERFFRSKASPVFGLALDIIKGETFIGEALSLEAESVREQAYQRLASLFIQDMIDAIKEEGWIGGFIALPGILGVGVVSYPGSIDAYERHVKDIPEDMLLDWQRGVQGSKGELTYQNLNVLQRAWLRRYCEGIGDAPERKEAGAYNFYEAQRETYEVFEALLTEEMQPIIKAYGAGRISLSDYIEQSEYLRNKYFGQASTLWLDSMREKLDPLLHKNLGRWHEEEIKPEDVAYAKYMELRANPPKVNGVPDWDSWERVLTRFMDGQTEEVKNYIEQRRIDWINKLSPERQSIEELILDCESVLDDYYAVTPEKIAEYKASHPDLEEQTIISRLRQEYRDDHPEVDARLILLRGLKPRSGFEQALELLGQYGITISPQMQKEYDEWEAGEPLRKAEIDWGKYIETHYDTVPIGDARLRRRDKDPYLDAILFVTGKTTVLRKVNLDEAERHVLGLMKEYEISAQDIPAFAQAMTKWYKLKNKWMVLEPSLFESTETLQEEAAAQSSTGYWWESAARNQGEGQWAAKVWRTFVRAQELGISFRKHGYEFDKFDATVDPNSILDDARFWAIGKAVRDLEAPQGWRWYHGLPEKFKPKDSWIGKYTPVWLRRGAGDKQQMARLESFLEHSTIDKKAYIVGEYMCGDFTRSLLGEALRNNVPIGYCVIYFKDLDAPAHAIAWININGVKHYIEPQSDRIMTKEELELSWMHRYGGIVRYKHKDIKK